MNRRKTILIVFLIVLSLLIFSIVYAGFSIRLEKRYYGDYFYTTNTPPTPPNVTFNIYDSATALTPVASQTFAFSEIFVEEGTQLQYRVATSTFVTSTIPFFKLHADFTNTDALARDMDLWVEMEFNGVVEGDREQVKHEAWSMFSYYDYYESVPRGVIMAWSGSINSIPQGWALCDGTNGTPDLRNTFIIGSANQSMVGKKGFFRHTHGAGGYSVPITHNPTPPPTTTWTSVSGTSASTQSLPAPYYSLAYIMKL